MRDGNPRPHRTSASSRPARRRVPGRDPDVDLGRPRGRGDPHVGARPLLARLSSAGDVSLTGVTINDMWWLFVPLVVVGVVLLFFGLLVFLGRFKNGALLRPVIARLSRIGFMRRFFTSLSTKAIERQNPDLANAIKKMNVVAANPNPQAAQKAMSRLTAAERRAYMDAAQEQQETAPELLNRQNRRRLQQQARGGRPGGGGTSARKRKRR
jgi:hypothetical protein